MDIDRNVEILQLLLFGGPMWVLFLYVCGLLG